ncbi:MAG: hypothetical protein J6C64_06725 [Lachnospiraceae bacterium]|nr:hypothetical protein [Lachnospiraceae bacterium]
MIDESQAIYELLTEEFPMKNTDNGVLVTIKTAQGKQDVSVSSNKFYSIVANKYRKKYGQIVSSGKIKNCVLSYQGQIIEECECVKNSNRCERGENNTILIDIGNREDTYFEISRNGIECKEDGSAFFYKQIRKCELPKPDFENADIERIFEYCRIPEHMRTIFIAYIVSLFIGDIEHPCLVLHGEQGVGKSTISKFIKLLVDPVGDSAPMELPSKLNELSLIYQDNYLIALDNLQKLNTKTSDKLCRHITGTEEFVRQLYTTNELLHFNLCQPIILNGLTDVVTRGDLASRCIILKIEKPISKAQKDIDKSRNLPNKSNGKVNLLERFMNDRPLILGGIFKLLVETLKAYQTKDIPQFGADLRMTDFYNYGYYICEAWEKGKGTEFCADYITLIENQLKGFAKNTGLIEFIKMYLEDIGGEWNGVMKDLSSALIDYEEGTQLDIVPASPNRLSRELRKLLSDFEEAGVYIKFSKTRNNSCYITLSLD